MKKIIFIMLLSYVTVSCFGQDSCRVLKSELVGKYTGDCKNGLAHGVGVAEGKDVYEGEFKKGLPHGKGRYIYSDGSIYEGDFIKGKRSGIGTYVFKEGDAARVQKGKWEIDKFIGEIKPQPYKVTIARNVERYNFMKFEGQYVRVIIESKANGFDSFEFLGNSGMSKDTRNNCIEYVNITFPFKGKVQYRSWNYVRTMQYDCMFEFEINEPGGWEITISAP